ncbi:DUF6527 family protein [Caballeronia sp. INSB1]|uniref:DUF6527 family protein n=1 Tax=Caballeronia sp. INSB1 TaxID=2921751 RepID=UPI002032FFB4|nr:DUF6527 family protein [Caballeronia sp. INSB1]
MARIQLTENGGALFNCPGCGMLHVVYLKTEGRPRWSFNGDIDKPTFSPSIKVWWTETPRTDPVEQVCHSFVIDGQIQFCGDSTHELAGQTVDLPEMEA